MTKSPIDVYTLTLDCLCVFWYSKKKGIAFSSVRTNGFSSSSSSFFSLAKLAARSLACAMLSFTGVVVGVFFDFGCWLQAVKIISSNIVVVLKKYCIWNFLIFMI